MIGSLACLEASIKNDQIKDLSCEIGEKQTPCAQLKDRVKPKGKIDVEGL